MKKRNAKLMTLLMTAALLSSSTMQAAQAEEGKTVKTGLSILTTVTGASASEEADGTAETGSVLVAVTVDEAGVIDSCVIDMAEAKGSFSAAGELTSEETEFLSKNELGEEYGMKAASSIGKEWYEQAAAMAEYAVGKTVEELKNGAVDESGKAADVDLLSSATIHLGEFISGIEAAVERAEDLGAMAGDELQLVSVTDSRNSQAASEEEDGAVRAETIAAAVTKNGETVTSCMAEGVRTETAFDGSGAVTADGETKAAVITNKDLAALMEKAGQ